MTRDSECIVILAETLTAAVETENTTKDSSPRINDLFRQLGEEFVVDDFEIMMMRLRDQYNLGGSLILPWFHGVNIAKHQGPTIL